MIADGHRLAAVIPAWNEATAIGGLTRDLRANGACCVFVVDGGSTDGTPGIAAAAGAIVVTEPRRGYGRACLTGAAHAAAHAAAEHPVVAFLDGDGSCDPADLPGLVAVLHRDGADLVLGVRSPATTEPGALPWHARMGNRLVAAILAVRTGRRVRDLPPFKAIRREALATLDLDDAGYGWTVQLIGRTLRDPRLRITEAPARFRRRRGGQSKVSGNLRASIAAGRRMIACAVAETRARPLIALMAKAPRAGHAKTRLAADIGQAAALELWTACLADLGPAIRAAARGIADTIAIVPADEDVEPVARLLGPGWPVVVQRRTGLDGAIVDAFDEADRRGADRAIAVSGDNPTLPPAMLLAALDALHHDPSVLGPCPDGGYYLVGARLGDERRRTRAGSSPAIARLQRVFETARLGGSSALTSTETALRVEGLRPRRLQPWPDVDTAADLGHLAATLVGDRTAPRTRAWIAAHANLIPEAQAAGTPDPNRPRRRTVMVNTPGSTGSIQASCFD